MQHIVLLMNRRNTQSKCIDSILCLLDCMSDSLTEHGNTGHRFLFLFRESTVNKEEGHFVHSDPLTPHSMQGNIGSKITSMVHNFCYLFK